MACQQAGFDGPCGIWGRLGRSRAEPGNKISFGPWLVRSARRRAALTRCAWPAARGGDERRQRGIWLQPRGNPAARVQFSLDDIEHRSFFEAVNTAPAPTVLATLAASASGSQIAEGLSGDVTPASRQLHGTLAGSAHYPPCSRQPRQPISPASGAPAPSSQRIPPESSAGWGPACPADWRAWAPPTPDGRMKIGGSSGLCTLQREASRSRDKPPWGRRCAGNSDHIANLSLSP